MILTPDAYKASALTNDELISVKKKYWNQWDSNP